MAESKKKNKRNEEKILGVPVCAEVNINKNYEDKSIKYKVTNLTVKNTPITVTGDLIETFIGGYNQDARTALKNGAKKVVTKTRAGEELYKIEVI